MTTINVQFSDPSEATIIGYAACEQPEESWPFQGVIGTDDPRWLVFYDMYPASQKYLPEPVTA